MKLTYSLTADDYTDFNVYFYASRFKSSYKLVGMVFLVLIVLNVYQVVQSGYFNPADLLSAPIGVCVGYFLLLVLLRSRWYMAYRCKRLIKSGRNAGLLGERTLLLSETGLQVTTAYFDCHYKWDAFEYLRESKSHLFLFISVNQAIIIPRRIFLLEQEAYDVRAFIERKLSS